MNPESSIPNAPTDRNPLVLSDFEPMYALSEEDHQAVIHRLAGLLVDTIEQLRDAGQTDQADTLASQAHDVLLSYDDDVAELVREAASAEDDEKGLGQAREKALW